MSTQISKESIEDDKYLQPVLEDDALLFSLDEVDEVPIAPPHGPDTSPRNADDVRKIAELKDEIERLDTQHSEYVKFVTKTLDQQWEQRPAGSFPAPSDKAKDQKDSDDGYFQSYSYNEIHKAMLSDHARTGAYRDFIYENKHLFKDKIVLDVGCGTGILSMFCARAGAAKVIAVDNSDIADKAREIVFDNKLDNVITVLRGKIEDVTLPVPKVDIIVSEWMGYCLLYEAMLDSVIWARDRYLALGGLMVPSHCVLRIAPLSDCDYVESKCGKPKAFWNDVYGFNMKAMIPAEEWNNDEVVIEHLGFKSVPAESVILLELPIATITVEELQFTKPFTVKMAKDVIGLDGWLIWFDTYFLPQPGAQLPDGDIRAESWERNRHPGAAFTTGPAQDTHWKIAIMIIDEPYRQKELKSGQKISGTVQYKKPKNSARSLEVNIEWDAEGTEVKGAGSWVCK